MGSGTPLQYPSPYKSCYPTQPDTKFRTQRLCARTARFFLSIPGHGQKCWQTRPYGLAGICHTRSVVGLSIRLIGNFTYRRQKLDFHASPLQSPTNSLALLDFAVKLLVLVSPSRQSQSKADELSRALRYCAICITTITRHCQ